MEKPFSSPKCWGTWGTNTFCKSCTFITTCRTAANMPASGADSYQAGGHHYKHMAIQPWAVVDTWPIAERVAFYRGNALKYLMRLNDKDAPITNAEKATHYCRKLVEVLSE